MIAKEWKILTHDNNKIKVLTDKFCISPLLAKLLINRGYITIEEISAILNPKIGILNNPFLLSDMEKVVERVRTAIEKQERILIYGDTDADGITGVTVLKQGLSQYRADTLWYVPQSQGYGLYKDAIGEHSKLGVKLIITVDCGITGIEEISYANSLGIDVIITDHHMPAETLPKAFAIVNPRLVTSKYPFSELSGCALAYKLIEALYFSYNSNLYNREMTVVDIETTSLKPAAGEICEIAAVKFKNFVITEEFQSLIKTKNGIPAELTSIHGITDEMCKTSPAVDEVLKKFKNFAGQSAIVAHNAEFDIGFINFYLEKTLNEKLSNEIVDTLSISRRLLPVKSHGLESLVSTLGLGTFLHHRAGEDCHATLELYRQLTWLELNQSTESPKQYLDLVVLGSIADAVSMKGENRLIINEGLSLLLKSQRICMKMILENCQLQDKQILTTRQISWLVTPFLNAAGRLGKANSVIYFLLTDNRAEAQKLFTNILELNTRRREMQHSALRKLLQIIDTEYDLRKDKIIVLPTTGIEPGISGIIANQLVQRYYRPVIILITDDKIVRGNARSPTNIDVLHLIHECSMHLNRFGGHRSAAGLELIHDNIDKFVECIKKVADKQISLDQIKPVLGIDEELKWGDINPKLISDINQLEPFGVGNDYPVFLIRDCQIRGHNLVGRDGLHLRLEFEGNHQKVEGLARGMGFMGYELSRQTKIDIVFQVETNVPSDIIRIILLDFKPSTGWKTNIYEEIEL